MQTVTLPTIDNALIFCASYDAAGRMINMQTVTITKNQGSATVADTAATVKLFLLDEHFSPKTEVITVSIS